jgi:hypothetical protein
MKDLTGYPVMILAAGISPFNCLFPNVRLAVSTSMTNINIAYKHRDIVYLVVIISYFVRNVGISKY